MTIKAPFPWFGGKRKVADLIWQRFGNVRNYVEPFFGSGAVLLNRPLPFDGVETVNDWDGLVANFWRALQHEPHLVAGYADNPVNENDLHARHALGIIGVQYRDPRNVCALLAYWRDTAQDHIVNIRSINPGARRDRAQYLCRQLYGWDFMERAVGFAFSARAAHRIIDIGFHNALSCMFRV